MLRVLPILLALALGIYAFIDCLTTPEDKVRSLPKLAWVFILLIFSMTIVAPVGWFAAGRPRRERPGVTGGRGRPLAPDDDPDFLASLDKRRPAPPKPPADERPAATPPTPPATSGTPGTPGTPDEEEMLRRWEEDLRGPENRLRDDVDGTDGPPEQRP